MSLQVFFQPSLTITLALDEIPQITDKNSCITLVHGTSSRIWTLALQIMWQLFYHCVTSVGQYMTFKVNLFTLIVSYIIRQYLSNFYSHKKVYLTKNNQYNPKFIIFTKGTVFTTLHFLLNLRMVPISYSITLHLAKWLSGDTF